MNKFRIVLEIEGEVNRDNLEAFLKENFEMTVAVFGPTITIKEIKECT